MTETIINSFILGFGIGGIIGGALVAALMAWYEETRRGRYCD